MEDLKEKDAVKSVPVPVTPNKKTSTEVYEHGFKIPLELHSQHQSADRIAFLRGSVIVELSPNDILRLGKQSPIKPGVRVGQIPWSAATGLFVNNLTQRNKALSTTIEDKKNEIINEILK